MEAGTRTLITDRNIAERRLLRTSAKSSSPWSDGRMSLTTGTGGVRAPEGP